MAGLLAAGAVVVGGYSLLKYLESDADHDTIVEETATNLARQLPADGKLYADHIGDYPNPRQVANDLDLAHVPDVVVRAGSVSNLMIEVETDGSLDDGGAEAKRQLEEFATCGYKNVLVVPDVDTDVVEEFEEQLNRELRGTIYVETPSTVTRLL